MCQYSAISLFRYKAQTMIDSRSQRYRWAARVELTAGKLNDLLAAPPENPPRPPVIEEDLIGRLIALTGYKQKSEQPREFDTVFKQKLPNQRDYMKDLAVEYHWDKERVISEYAKLDENGKIPRKNRTQDSCSYAKAMWNDGIQKGWLRDQEQSQFQEDLKAILDYLNDHKVRASYGAVAEALGIHHARDLAPLLGERRPEVSWIVNKGTGMPTGYSEEQVHPDLNSSTRFVTESAVLRHMIGW